MDNEVKNKSHLFAFSLPNFLLPHIGNLLLYLTLILNKISKLKVNKIKL